MDKNGCWMLKCHTLHMLDSLSTLFSFSKSGCISRMKDTSDHRKFTNQIYCGIHSRELTYPWWDMLVPWRDYGVDDHPLIDYSRLTTQNLVHKRGRQFKTIKWLQATKQISWIISKHTWSPIIRSLTSMSLPKALQLTLIALLPFQQQAVPLEGSAHHTSKLAQIQIQIQESDTCSNRTIRIWENHAYAAYIYIYI